MGKITTVLGITQSGWDSVSKYNDNRMRKWNLVDVEIKAWDIFLFKLN